jgi:hypothetical protein
MKNTSVIPAKAGIFPLLATEKKRQCPCQGDLSRKKRAQDDVVPIAMQLRLMAINTTPSFQAQRGIFPLLATEKKRQCPCQGDPSRKKRAQDDVVPIAMQLTKLMEKSMVRMTCLVQGW